MSLSQVRLELLNLVAGRNEDDAKAVLAKAQARLAEQQALFGELQQYLEDYQQRLPARPTPMLLDNQRQFCGKLIDALNAQQATIDAEQGRVKQANERWLAMRRELRITEHLQQQGDLEVRRIEEKASQREMDEFATVRHFAASQRS
ncbi:MAG: flagellar export protein FliJ [Nevskia sp.]|nr:flagellar export protein FliJ [Nevskia sp.]